VTLLDWAAIVLLIKICYNMHLVSWAANTINSASMNLSTWPLEVSLNYVSSSISIPKYPTTSVRMQIDIISELLDQSRQLVIWIKSHRERSRSKSHNRSNRQDQH